MKEGCYSSAERDLRSLSFGDFKCIKGEMHLKAKLSMFLQIIKTVLKSDTVYV